MQPLVDTHLAGGKKLSPGGEAVPRDARQVLILNPL
jgi:hypothetical protein